MTCELLIIRLNTFFACRFSKRVLDALGFRLKSYSLFGKRTSVVMYILAPRVPLIPFFFSLWERPGYTSKCCLRWRISPRIDLRRDASDGIMN